METSAKAELTTIWQRAGASGRLGVWFNSDRQFMRHAHGRAIGFQLGSQVHTITLDKGIEVFFDSSIPMMCSTQYIFGVAGYPTQLAALGFKDSDVAWIA